MANKAKIEMTVDPKTKKKNITIKMESDGDMLPHEHEQAHRSIVDKLIEGGLVKASELGEITVERGEVEVAQVETKETTPQKQAISQNG